jgi:hypothetical protein
MTDSAMDALNLGFGTGGIPLVHPDRPERVAPNRRPSFVGMALRRVAAARGQWRRLRAIRDLPDYALADAGYTRDWRGNLKPLPRGMLR